VAFEQSTVGEVGETIRDQYSRLIDSSVAPSIAGDAWFWGGQMKLPIFLARFGRPNLSFARRLDVDMIVMDAQSQTVADKLAGDGVKGLAQGEARR